MDKTETVVEVTSSAMLTGTLPAPAVVTVTAGLTTRDFTALTPPDINKPASRAKTGWTYSTTEELAAKTMAPAAGRTKLWIMSLMWFTSGILSASISITVRKIKVPIIHQEVMPSQGDPSFIKSVYLAINDTTNKGIYAFNPVLAERPKAEKIFKTSNLCPKLYYMFKPN